MPEATHQLQTSEQGFFAEQRSVAVETSEFPIAYAWQTRSMLQIYPLSFYDPMGKGNGTFQGITEKISLIRELGFGLVHINPWTKSPMEDNGYDVSDYKRANPLFGTDAELFFMLDQFAQANVGPVMDFPLNHTSREHPAFINALNHTNPQARAAFRNLYVFRKGQGDKGELPPTNWVSFFGGSAWTELTNIEPGMWYFHKFSEGQPDTNMANPRVQQIMLNTLKFWLENGIKGFRFDVYDHSWHDSQFRDMRTRHRLAGEAEIDEYYWRERYIIVKPAYEFLVRISGILKQYGAVGFGEVIADDLPHVAKLINSGLDVPLNTCLLEVTNGYGISQRYNRTVSVITGAHFQAAVDAYMQHLPPGGWPSFSLSNHDQLNQLASRVGQENMPAITVMHYALGGTTIVYYPDLIGMEDNQNLTLANSKDLQGLNAKNEDGTKGNLLGVEILPELQWNGSPEKIMDFHPQIQIKFGFLLALQEKAELCKNN